MRTQFLTKIWKDPVWSKVIAAGLIFILSQVIIWIWSIIAKIPFFSVYMIISNWGSMLITINLWTIIFYLVCLIILLIIARIIYPRIIIIKVKRTIKNPRNKSKYVHQEQKDEKPTISEESTVFFHHRICEAFPGVNYLEWFNSPREAINRLQILLKPPTKFEKVLGDRITSDPIWWFRGYEALFIENFKRISKSKCLINYDECEIEKIAVYRGSSYFRDFVYVQCKPEKPIGLYKHDKSGIQKSFEERGKYFEEYGLYKNRPITRQEYDDGAALIKGKVVNVIGNTELRVRSLTKYNFIIAAKFSPYNCDEMNHNSLEYFKFLLNGKIKIEEFINWTKNWPKNHND